MKVRDYSEMKVSIITSVYNCKNFVKEMIDSIIDQTYSEWEMILIDDASYDGTWDIITKIEDERIIKIRNQGNLGLTKNLNRALELASGKYIMRMDADDIAVKSRIENQIEFMENNLDVVLSGGWMQCFGEMHNVIKTHLSHEDICIDLIFGSAIMHPTFIIRREVLKKYDIKYNEKLKYSQDYDFTYRISEFGKLANIPEILVKYRTHRNQIGAVCRDWQREYADVTRKRIICDMNVKLTDNEFNVWSDFCCDKLNSYTDEERELLPKVVRKVVDSNGVDCKYNRDKLNRVLTQKMQAITDKNKVDVKKDYVETEKYKRLFNLMNRLIRLKQNGISFSDWFEIKNYYRIALYGMGDVGECVLGELRNSSIEVVYGIDRDCRVLCSLKKVVTPDDSFECVDAIIITAIFYADEIKSVLEKKISYPIISLEEIIYEMELL